MAINRIDESEDRLSLEVNNGDVDAPAEIKEMEVQELGERDQVCHRRIKAIN